MSKDNPLLMGHVLMDIFANKEKKKVKEGCIKE